MNYEIVNELKGVKISCYADVEEIDTNEILVKRTKQVDDFFNLIDLEGGFELCFYTEYGELIRTVSNARFSGGNEYITIYNCCND